MREPSRSKITRQGKIITRVNIPPATSSRVVTKINVRPHRVPGPRKDLMREQIGMILSLAAHF
jgi:hypothetical protein